MDHCSRVTQAICQCSAGQGKREMQSGIFWCTRTMYLGHAWVMDFRWGDGDSSRASTWWVGGRLAFFTSDACFGFSQLLTFCIWKPSRRARALITETQGRIQRPHLSPKNPPWDALSSMRRHQMTRITYDRHPLLQRSHPWCCLLLFSCFMISVLIFDTKNKLLFFGGVFCGHMTLCQKWQLDLMACLTTWAVY